MITLGMITKNEEAILKETLPHLKKAGLPIVVVDTGSTDNTVDYLRSEGARVVTGYQWNHDFAHARNALLKEIDTKWVLFLDADEVIPEDGLRVLIDTISDTDETFFNLPIYQTTIGKWSTHVEKNYRIKVYRADLGYHYERPVNEMIFGFPVEKLSDPGTMLETVPVFHWGNYAEVDPEKFEAKELRYIEIFSKALARPEYADDFNLHYQIGMHYDKLGDYWNARRHTHASIRLCAHPRIRLFLYYAYLKLILARGQSNRVYSILTALESQPASLNRELYFMKGKIEIHDLNKLKDAFQSFGRSLDQRDPEDDLVFTRQHELQGHWQYVYLGQISESFKKPEWALDFYTKAKQCGDYWPELEAATKRVSEGGVA